jgi:hypothetical protein
VLQCVAVDYSVSSSSSWATAADGASTLP